MPETMEKTTLKYLKPGDHINLEPALRLSDRMGGHIVQGHIDGIGMIKDKAKKDIALIYEVKAPPAVLKYTVPKGSITIDGTSLTVIDVFADYFTVSLIPFTAKHTILGEKENGDYVNLESDILGRYIEKLLKSGNDTNKSSINLNFLAENGFI
jgi:riboflavin synthase